MRTLTSSGLRPKERASAASVVGSSACSGVQLLNLFWQITRPFVLFRLCSFLRVYKESPPISPSPNFACRSQMTEFFEAERRSVRGKSRSAGPRCPSVDPRSRSAGPRSRSVEPASRSAGHAGLQPARAAVHPGQKAVQSGLAADKSRRYQMHLHSPMARTNCRDSSPLKTNKIRCQHDGFIIPRSRYHRRVS